MADFIIKSAAGTGNNTLIQGADASPAITIADTGTTTFAENVTMSGTANNLGTISSATTFPAGHIIQTSYDTYPRVGALQIDTTANDYMGSDLEVSITCKSTSNKLYIQLFIPDYHNSTDASVGLNTGFRYHADFSSSDGTQLGERNFIDSHHGFTNVDETILEHVSIMTIVAVPVTTAIKIRPWMSAVNAHVDIFGNANSSQEVGTLIVQEIQG